MHRFYVPDDLPLTGAFTLPADTAHRVTRVLRLRAGDHLRLFDRNAREVEAELEVGGGSPVVRVLASLPPAPAIVQIALYPALIRPNRFEWLIEKATELGVAAIHPVITERCQVRAEEIGGTKRERWGRIVIEAAEQCGRRTIPTIAEPVSFTQAIEDIQGSCIIPYEQERRQAPALGSLLRGHSWPNLTLLIGPEGGFSAQEIALARIQGATTVSLGPLVLRAETAAVAALAIVIDSLA